MYFDAKTFLLLLKLSFQCSIATSTLVKDLNVSFNSDKIPNIHTVLNTQI